MTESGGVKASVTNIGKSIKLARWISVGTTKNLTQRNALFRPSSIPIVLFAVSIVWNDVSQSD
jgi:hypothetical protein